MEVKGIYKVKAEETKLFRQLMRKYKRQQDAPATILNICAGYNYFYETGESYGDITEETALRMAEQNNLKIIDLSKNI